MEQCLCVFISTGINRAESHPCVLSHVMERPVSLVMFLHTFLFNAHCLFQCFLQSWAVSPGRQPEDMFSLSRLLLSPGAASGNLELLSVCPKRNSGHCD